ncbi:hypothetical protein E2C01_012064 [Portunus trituberculatus]|uniref:Uncharacterized protein n=1 Tax=Portunus trituberculatus TaxID=210409 RepID=A0A5B7DDM0_PORTR|nr:hypothetical protein [Portunus trituberculatus]
MAQPQSFVTTPLHSTYCDLIPPHRSLLHPQFTRATHQNAWYVRCCYKTQSNTLSYRGSHGTAEEASTEDRPTTTLRSTQETLHYCLASLAPSLQPFPDSLTFFHPPLPSPTPFSQVANMGVTGRLKFVMALHGNVIICDPGESATMAGNVENSRIGRCICFYQ